MGKIKYLNLRALGLASAAAAMMTCTGCVNVDDGKLVVEIGNKKIVIDAESFGADLTQEGSQINISKKQNETTTTPIFTTTYDAQVTPGTTVYLTTKPVTTTKEAKVTTTNTTEREQPVTRVTPEPRLTMPAKYTTTATTTTVPTTTVPVQEPAAQDMLIEPEIIPKEVEETISYENYNVIQGKEYKVISDKNTVSGSGEGLFSVQYNNYGVYSDALKEKIKEMNNLKEDFVVEQQEPLILPTVVLYRGKSADEIQMETGVAKEEIIRLNGIEKSNIERNFIIAILEPKQNEFTDMYGQNRIIYKDMVIIADRIVEHENNSALVFHEERDAAHNTVEYMVFNGKNVKTTVIARDAAHISQYGIQCHNKLSQETFGISKKPNNLITQVCNVPGFNVFSNGVNIVVSKKTPDQMKAGYEVINILGGKQLTK